MNQLVKVKVRPGKTLSFPAICVHCAQPANESLVVSKRSGQIRRLIDVPVCTECSQELRRQSGEEERLQRLGWLAVSITGLLVLVITFFLLPGPWPLLRLFIALVPALLIATVIYSIFRKKMSDAARPQKRAILESARMVDFSWRATTFEFNNEAFAESFSEINESRLMEL